MVAWPCFQCLASLSRPLSRAKGPSKTCTTTSTTLLCAPTNPTAELTLHLIVSCPEASYWDVVLAMASCNLITNADVSVILWVRR